MKKIKWFSLIEIIIVMAIILWFLAIFQNIFKPKNIQVYYWQKCVNDLYAFINTFNIAWLSSKWFDIWWNMIYPIAYKTEIISNQNKVINYIDTWAGYFELQIANLSGVNSPNDLCYINQMYRVELTWENITIESIKWSANNQFNISWWIYSWHIDLLLYQNWWSYTHIWQYTIDKRSQTIIKRICLSLVFNWTWCTQRNQ